MIIDPQEWQQAGIEQLRLDTEDFVASPSLSKIQLGVEFIENHANRCESVYVHCKAGRTRSTTLVACYLIKVSCGAEGGVLRNVGHNLIPLKIYSF